jgi:hypothetical protein
MAIPQKFHLPWSEIDPAMTHGGIPGELTEFVGPDLGDNPRTKNQDIKIIFTAVMTTAASISMAPEANKEGPPQRNIVEETLRSLNFIFERILDRTQTMASNTFEWCHATPPYEYLMLRPVRYPLRQAFADQVTHYLLGTLVEIAEMNRNANHSLLDPNTAHRMMAPLFHLKKLICKDYFDVEVAGEISLNEMIALMSSVKKVGPVVVPPGESQNLASAESVAEAMTGIDLLQWYPNDQHWATFGEKLAQMYHPERVWQPEGAYPTTEDVASENTIQATNTLSNPVG